MNPSRVKNIHKIQNNKTNILYLMHNAFRLNDNHSLERAITLKTKHDTVTIVLTPPIERNQRNSDFFHEGIKNLNEVLPQVSDQHLMITHNDETLLDLIKESKHVVMDMPYLLEEKEYFEYVKTQCVTSCVSLDVVETNVLVPVLQTSDKEEYSARTIRKKIWEKVPIYLDEVEEEYHGFSYEKKANQVLIDFIENKLDKYHDCNHPEFDYTSGLSPYLKYGFISPLTIYLALRSFDSENKESFLEELIIRRELSYNFVYFNDKYNKFEGITYQWAYQSMNAHLFDERKYLYTIKDYINFDTHDPYFNTAMKEMVLLGKMHGYMRMYWAKKVIEWSTTYEEAYNTLIYLNNHYFIDGNTPNGYTGVAWCFGKHDRAWTERQIFGKIRYMNMNGLKRKFDIDSYVKRIDQEVRKSNE